MSEENQRLDLKYRPKDFDAFVGNESMIKSLKSVVNREKGVPHAFLFSGPSGTGKTTLGRILKKGFNCSKEDFKEFNSANMRGIETIRKIDTICSYPPMFGPSRVIMLDEAHKITTDGQHALLKLLEDTPDHVYFILCTTEPEKLIKTIRTRCSTFQTSSLPDRVIVSLLSDVNEKEGFDTITDEMKAIAKISEGSARQALVILDSVIDIGDDDDRMKAIQDYTIHESTIIELCDALLNRQKWVVVSKILKSLDEEPEKVRYSVLGRINGYLLKIDNPRAALIIDEFLESFMYSKKAGLTLACYRIVKFQEQGNLQDDDTPF